MKVPRRALGHISTLCHPPLPDIRLTCLHCLLSALHRL